MEKKKNKKRLGIVALVLLLILAIGATAGTTLAKYVTKGSQETYTATVAKWGYTISANATDLFSQQYNAGAHVSAQTGYDNVDVSGASKVVAPGTKGTTTISVNGSAEVNAELKIEISEFQTILLSKGEEDVANDYYPIEWKIGGGDALGTANKVDKETFANAFATAVSNAIDGVTATVATSDDGKTTITAKVPAGTSISMTALAISWEWKFENEKDAEDTLLGILANETEQNQDTRVADYRENSVIEIKLAYTISVTQTQN